MKAIITTLTGEQTSRTLNCRGVLAIYFMMCTLGLSVSASAQKQPALTTFDVPGGRSTYVMSMNPAGIIVGFSMMRASNSTPSCVLAMERSPPLMFPALPTRLRIASTRPDRL
jgi:hypothetical protein